MMRFSSDQNVTLPIIDAISIGNIKIIKLLMAQDNFDINAQDFFGDTALLAAIRANNEDVVKILLNAGADKTLKNFFSETPESIATHNRYNKIIMLLKDNYKVLHNNHTNRRS